MPDKSRVFTPFLLAQDSRHHFVIHAGFGRLLPYVTNQPLASAFFVLSLYCIGCLPPSSSRTLWAQAVNESPMLADVPLSCDLLEASLSAKVLGPNSTKRELSLLFLMSALVRAPTVCSVVLPLLSHKSAFRIRAVTSRVCIGCCASARMRIATWTATRYSPVIRKCYRHLHTLGKPKKVALISAMRKLLTILKAMIKTQKPWIEDHFPLLET